MLIELKDLTFDAAKLVALSKGLQEGTQISIDIYTLTLFLNNIPTPLIIGFETKEERDTSYDMVLEVIKELR